MFHRRPRAFLDYYCQDCNRSLILTSGASRHCKEFRSHNLARDPDCCFEAKQRIFGPFLPISVLSWPKVKPCRNFDRLANYFKFEFKFRQARNTNWKCEGALKSSSLPLGRQNISEMGHSLSRPKKVLRVVNEGAKVIQAWSHNGPQVKLRTNFQSIQDQ